MNRRHVHTTSVASLLWWSGGHCVVRLTAGSWHKLPCWEHGLFLRCVVSSIAPHFHGLYSLLQLCCEGPWFTSIWEAGCDRGSTPVVFWNWEKWFCHSRPVPTLSVLLLSVLSLRVSQIWNPCQFELQLNPGTWSLWLSQASVHLLWSLCWCHWCCLSMTGSSWHWSPCHRLWRLSRCAANFVYFSPAKPLTSSARQRLAIVLPPMLTVSSWSSKASVLILSRNMWKKVDESRHPVGLQLFFGTSLLCCQRSGVLWWPLMT